MKAMNRFGNALHSYEGVARIKVEEGGSNEGGDYREIKGYFEAAQFLSGRVHISMVETNSRTVGKVSLSSDRNSELTFEGHDFNGWEIKTIGEQSYSLFSLAFPSPPGNPRPFNLGAKYLKAKLRRVSANGYSKARFLVSNLLWNGDFGEQPEPLKLEVQDVKVEVKPVADYAEVAERLKSTEGADPTAHVCIKISSGEHWSLESYQNFLEDLLYVFRLVTGNQVDWYYGEAYEDQTEHPVERVHKYAITGPYSD